jgi:hypothetical protein
MALKKQVSVKGQSFVQTEGGRISKGIEDISFIAYIKVISVTGDKDRITATVQFSDKNWKLENKYIFSASVEDGSKNFIEQAYIHLKTLPEFEDSTDC